MYHSEPISNMLFMSLPERAHSLQAVGKARAHGPWPAANSHTQPWSAT